MKTITIEAKVDDKWEPYDCDKFPFSYLGDWGYDGLAHYCILDNKHSCPASEAEHEQG
ncbi:MAG: hypothetical protein PUF78_04145 [Lachnospiraceae bacterium]|nr:hypothetical protein [Lachnospiraceae bacterium]